MKKTFSININGSLFNIDEDAFEKLNSYLKTLKKHFQNTEGGNEIVDDIEARIAEILKVRLTNLQNIIGLKDVDFVIETLGQPFEMDEDTSTGSGNYSKHTRSGKRVFRDPDDQIIAGVASGLAAYFNIDPLIVRLIFVISILIGGAGIVVYLTLWILTPLATTTSEKLEMEGEKVDIRSIEKKVREDLVIIKGKLQDFTVEAGDVLKKKRKDSTSGLNHFGHFLFSALRVFFRSLAILIGVVFLLVGIAFSLAFVAAFLSFTPGGLVFDEFNIQGIAFTTFLNQYIISSPYKLVLNIALFLVLFIPIVALIFNGIRLIFNLGRQRILGISTTVLWVVALFIALSLSFRTLEQFNMESKIITVNKLDSLQSDTLKLAILNQKFYTELQSRSSGSVFFGDEELMLNLDDAFYGNPKLTFSKSDDDFFELIVRTSARGKNTREAIERINNIKYQFVTEGNTLQIDPYFTLLNNEKWRDQQVSYEIKIPEGKSLFLDKGTKNYFQWRYWEHSRRTMAGNYWLMTSDGLTKISKNE